VGLFTERFSGFRYPSGAVPATGETEQFTAAILLRMIEITLTFEDVAFSRAAPWHLSPTGDQQWRRTHANDHKDVFDPRRIAVLRGMEGASPNAS